MIHFLLTIFSIFSLSSVYYVAMKPYEANRSLLLQFIMFLGLFPVKWDGKEGRV